MKLLPAEQLQDLIVHSPELTRERRELLVDFMSDLAPDDLEQFVLGELTAANEIAFIRSCCGLPAVERQLLKSI